MSQITKNMFTQEISCQSQLTSSGITVRTSRSRLVFSTLDNGLKIVAKSTVPCCRINAASWNIELIHKHRNNS